MASFTGSHLVERLLQKGAATVRVADDLSSGKLENLVAVQNDIDFLKGDLRDTSVAQNATRDCDVVFHLAADHGGRGYISSHPANCAGNMALDTVFRAAVNVGTDEFISLNRVADEIFNLMNWRPHSGVKHLTDKPVGVIHRALDQSFARKTTRWKPQISFRRAPVGRWSGM